jgi:hypothetical protein
MKRVSVPVLLALVLSTGHIDAQVVTEWVESKLPGETDKIALGYPVPIPVDTPLPFDGFRTYAGLHSRHLDLVDTTQWVHPEDVGETRYGRTIWAYRLGDADLLTVDGLPEPASLVNGGIHAREWQSPEVVTGIMELFALHESDAHFYDYLRDNLNMVVIPVLNIDGFLQTQREPSLSYTQSDPDNPGIYPREGRMRRKNMLSADEDFGTTVDHLNGVDLNRNNAPFWASNPTRSSPNLQSIVHHGAAAASEPEIQALDAAAQLGPVERLRIYTDAHSFSQVHFWSINDNDRLSVQTESVLRLFSDHHRTFPAEKYYGYSRASQMRPNHGIGLTAEYFTHTYQVPSWTLEIEPENGGVDYGGTGENSHDGFILPDSQIRRVREELAQSFAAAWYRQAGPPSIQSLRVIDTATEAVVFEADWDVVDDQSRMLHRQQLRALQLGHDYDLWLSFNKPMRWREDGQAQGIPGVSQALMYFLLEPFVGESELTSTVGDPTWLDAPGRTPDGYANYIYDAVRVALNIPVDEDNLGLVTGTVDATLKFLTADMTRLKLDANPATVADWADGAWVRHDNGFGAETDSGGWDSTISLQLSSEEVEPPFVLEPGISASWYDPSRDGEGFLIELLENDRAVMYWFTYDSEGNQDWYVASGKVRGNYIEFPKLKQASGGEFGPGFDPDNITREVVGSASFIWSGCDTGTMSYRIGTQHGRMQLNRITQLLGVECGIPRMQPLPEHALLSGSWYDPSHDGEGYLVEALPDDRAVVYWFSYDPEGNRRWFFDAGKVIDGKLVFDNMRTTSGGVFGPDFDPNAVERPPWGTLELDLDCNGGSATYSSTEEGFGAGVLNLVRLTSIDQFSCDQ